MIIEVIFYIILAASITPVGLLLAWLCEDELIKDRKYFFAMIYASLIIMIFLFFFYFKPSIIFSLAYFILVLLILVRRGKRLEKKIRKISRRKKYSK